MIMNVVWMSWANLCRDRIVLLLGYLVPLAFFSIYAGVSTLSRQGSYPAASSGPRTLGVVDEDRSEVSRRFVQLLRAQPGIAVREAEDATPLAPYDGKAAEAALHEDRIGALLVIPHGFEAAPLDFLPGGAPASVELVVNGSDPLAPLSYGAMLQQAALALAPDVLSASGPQSVEGWTGGLAPSQRAHMAGQFERAASLPSAPGMQPGALAVTVRTVAHAAAPDPAIAFYAAAMGVMTILFTATGAATSLIEENESGILARVLSSRLSLFQLLSGKLLFTMAFCLSQLAAIFLWAALAFHLELLPHLGGWLLVSLLTSFAAAAFSLAVAAFCRTRARIFALSGLIVLAMGALGGSMFPRFLMPAFVQDLGLITFNAWALDGFTKVFWRQMPVAMLWPEIAALLAFTVFFFSSALWLARRWEMA